jgi:hypothetical protein
MATIIRGTAHAVALSVCTNSVAGAFLLAFLALGESGPSLSVPKLSPLLGLREDQQSNLNLSGVTQLSTPKLSPVLGLCEDPCSNLKFRLESKAYAVRIIPTRPSGIVPQSVWLVHVVPVSAAPLGQSDGSLCTCGLRM